MTATTAKLTAGLMRPVVFIMVWTTATLNFSFVVDVAAASKDVALLRSSIERLNALKQLMNAEQVGPAVAFLNTIHAGYIQDGAYNM